MKRSLLIFAFLTGFAFGNEAIIEQWIPEEDLRLTEGDLVSRAVFDQAVSKLRTSPPAPVLLENAVITLEESERSITTQITARKSATGWQSIKIPANSDQLQVADNTIAQLQEGHVLCFLQDPGVHQISWTQPAQVHENGRHRQIEIIHPGAPIARFEAAGQVFALSSSPGPQRFAWETQDSLQVAPFTQSVSQLIVLSDEQMNLTSRHRLHASTGTLPSTVKIENVPGEVLQCDGVERWTFEDQQLVLTLKPQPTLDLTITLISPISEGIPSLGISQAARTTHRLAVIGQADIESSLQLPEDVLSDSDSFPSEVYAHPHFIGAWVLPTHERAISILQRKTPPAVAVTTQQATFLTSPDSASTEHHIHLTVTQGQLQTFRVGVGPQQQVRKVRSGFTDLPWTRLGQEIQIELPRTHAQGDSATLQLRTSLSEALEFSKLTFPQSTQTHTELSLDWPKRFQLTSTPSLDFQRGHQIAWPDVNRLSLTLDERMARFTTEVTAYAKVERGQVAIFGEIVIDPMGTALTSIELPWKSVEFQNQHQTDEGLRFPKAITQPTKIPFSMKIPREGGRSLTLPNLEVPGASRHVKTWMLVSAPSVRLAVQAEGWRASFTPHKPTLHGYQPETQILGTYTSISPSPDLTLTLDDLKLASVSGTVIETATLNSVATGKTAPWWHQMNLHVRYPQAAKPLLIKLPPSAEIWSLKVNDSLTKPVLKNEDTLQLQLPPADPSGTRVRLVYQTPTEAPPQILGDIPILKTSRQFFAPEHLALTSTDLPPPPSVLTALFDWEDETSEATLQLNRESHDMKIFHGQGRAPKQAISLFEAERDLIVSASVLGQVVDKLALEKRWKSSRFEAIKKLKNNLKVREISGTDLISIRSKLGPEIVNAVTAAYQEQRRENEHLRSSHALATLQQQLKQQSDKVEEARLRMLDLAERYRIIDLSAMQNRASITGDPVTGTGTILMQSMNNTFEAESAIATIKLQIEKLESVKGEKLIQAAAMLDIADPTLQTLFPMYQQYILERQALLDTGLRSDHPKIKAIEEQIAKYRSMLVDAITSVRSTLKTKLEMATRALDLAKDMEEGKKDTSMDERRKYAEYSESSKEYELQKNMLANMQSKFATEQVDLTMPKLPVTIHEEATTPNQVAGILPLDVDLPELVPKFQQESLGDWPDLDIKLDDLRTHTRKAWLALAGGALLFLALARKPWLAVAILTILLGFVIPRVLPEITQITNGLLLGALVMGLLHFLNHFRRRSHA